MPAAVILAGGRGLRLGKLTRNSPKPLVKVAGKPIIEHQVSLLKRYGIKDVWILSGYLGNMIEKHFGGGKRFGVRVHHIIEKSPLGTAGALKILDGQLMDDFVLFSGDVICDFDISSLLKFHIKNKATGTIVVHPNDHPFDSDLVEVDQKYRVRSLILRKYKIQNRQLDFKNLVCASMYVFSPKVLKYVKKDKESNIEKDLLTNLLKCQLPVYAYNTSEYIKDVGTTPRLIEVSRDVKSGKVARLNKKNKRPAIFLDRDGVINEEVDKLNEIRDLKLIPGTGKAIKKINATDYLAVVVTNQAAIAKGILSENKLSVIHKKLETLLAKDGAKLDAIYYCPHHPVKGFKGEIKSLKINCICRKPKVGLIKRAAKDLNIDLKRSYFIGDSTVDAKTAKNAGVKFIGVETGYGMKDARYLEYAKIETKRNLLTAVNSMLR